MCYMVKIRNINGDFQILSLCFLLLSLILFFTSCKQKAEPFSILEFTGNEAVLNYSKSLYMISHSSDSVNPTALLASEGDMIFYGDELFIYRKSSGNKFQFNISNEGGYINGKMTTLNLRRSKDVIPWFKQMEAADLSMLEFIKIDSLIPEYYYPYLANLARIKPGTGICYDGDLNDISRVIKLFNPRFLIGATVSGGDFELLSTLTNLEILVAELNDSVNRGPLPSLPALKHLFLSKVSNKIVMNDIFLSENRSLERITILESDTIDFSVFNPLDNLKELVICNFEKILNFDLIKKHTSLEVLSISDEKSDYRAPTNVLTGIRWMAFSPDFTQDAFDSFINSHGNLEVVEILENDTISSLSSLLKLKNLYGLTISDTLTDLASVKKMKNLRYLSLPSYLFKDKSVIEDLQKLLPATRIVANEGFCLGSGWLMLIVPLILFFSLVFRKKFHESEVSA